MRQVSLRNGETKPARRDAISAAQGPTPRRAKARRLGWAAGTGAVASVAALLVIVSPLASAHVTVTFTPPFSGFTQSPYNYSSATGCAGVHQSSLPTWTSSTGTFQVSSSTNAGKCAGTNLAEAYSAVSLSSPAFTTQSSGPGYVYATIGAAFSAHASLHLAHAYNGSYIYGDAEVYVVASIDIYDVTHGNGTFFGYATDTIVSQEFLSTGSFSLSSSWTNTTIYAIGTFAMHHVYQLEIYIAAVVFAETYGGGSTGAASIDLAGSNGLTVYSVIAN